MSELIVPLVVTSDECLTDEQVGLGATHDVMLFSDGTRADWVVVTLDEGDGQPPIRHQSCNVYGADGAVVIDPLRAARRARDSLTSVLISEACSQDRPELLPPSSLLD
jgi:hypothetical protein